MREEPRWKRGRLIVREPSASARGSELRRAIGVGKLILVWIDCFEALAELSGTRWIRETIIAEGKMLVVLRSTSD